MGPQPPGGSFGRRLVPVTIDEIARDTPEREWALLPSRDRGRDRYQSITYAVFANAINSMAWFMDHHLGRPPAGQFPTVCYIGRSDMRYQVVQVAAAKTEFKVRSCEKDISETTNSKKLINRCSSHHTSTPRLLISTCLTRRLASFSCPPPVSTSPTYSSNAQ